MRLLLALLALGIPPGPSDSGSAGDEPERAPMTPDPGAPSAGSLLDPEQHAVDAAVARALDWLAEQQGQLEDGSFPTTDADDAAPLATCALAALAFMSAGHGTERGPHADTVSSALEYLLDHANTDPRTPRYGYLGMETAADAHSRMHGHGFATLALSQAYGMAPRSALGGRIARALPPALRLIERTQGAEGGWWYGPERSPSHEGSVTICLVQALRAAHNAGIQVDRDVVHQAEVYVLESQKEDGSFRYMQGSDRSSAALTAAAVTTLNAAGRYSGPVIDSALDAIWRELEAREIGEGTPSQWPFYERLYLAQAFWQHSDPSHFERWSPRERLRVLSDQREDGSWGDRQHGDVYATAMNCLFLTLPEGVLPIFQR